MPLDSSCGRCGRPVKRVEFDGELLELDPTPSFDGRFRLSAEDRTKAERIERPGFQGYQPHAETCPAA